MRKARDPSPLGRVLASIPRGVDSSLRCKGCLIVPSRIANRARLLCVGTLAVAFAACGEEDNPSPPLDPGGGSGTDFMAMSMNGSSEATYVEASGLPNIDCDPRVDWGASQVILWNDFTGGEGPNGYELFFEIMFPVADSVGTYTVHGNYLQAMLHENGTYYTASPLLNTSSGTVHVTRSDDRIEGDYSVTLVDADATTSVTMTGRFGVDRGFSLSCP